MDFSTCGPLREKAAFCRVFPLLILMVLAGPGCSSYRAKVPNLPWFTSSPTQSSQSLVPTQDHARLWEAIVAGVGETFTIASEEPIRLYDNVISEGRLETEPKIAASLLEPWHNDSVSLGDRMESTYQTLRRKAIVRVSPESDGFLVQVSVLCEMEDLSRPIQSNTSGGLLPSALPSERVSQSRLGEPQSNGWFLIDRDPALEQQLLRQILHRFKNPPNLIRAAEPELY